MRAKLQEIKETLLRQTPTNPKAGRVVAPSRNRLFRVPCRSDKRTGHRRVSLPRHHVLARGASAAESERPHGVGPNEKARRRMAADAAHPSSLAKRTLRRQTPEVGAGCPNWARPVLCGGRSEMSVPTANTATRYSLGEQQPIDAIDVRDLLGEQHLPLPTEAAAVFFLRRRGLDHRAHPRFPRLNANSARSSASPSILSVLARLRLRDVAIEAGSTTWISIPPLCSTR